MNPFTCLALSPAGKVPVHGRNNYHVYNGQPMASTGWFCDESRVQAGSWDGGREYNAQYWNRKFDKNGLDAPEGWRWAQLRVEYIYMGGKRTILEKPFIGFHTNHPNIYVGDCLIDRPRYLHDLQLYDLEKNQVFDCAIPEFKSHSIGCYAYANEAYCTDGAKWPIINAFCYSYKYVEMFERLKSRV